MTAREYNFIFNLFIENVFAKPGIARLMSGMARSSYGKSFIQFSKSDLRAMDIISKFVETSLDILNYFIIIVLRRLTYGNKYTTYTRMCTFIIYIIRTLNNSSYKVPSLSPHCCAMRNCVRW